MASTTAAASELAEGPAMSLISKKLRALRKRHNRILQMEESLSQGKSLNKEQEEVLRSKSSVLTLIEELEKLRFPLSAAISDEINAAIQRQNDMIFDLLNLLYFGSLFDVKSQTDFTSTMLTRTHERGCCLTYDYVTDDATDLLSEADLDSISSLGNLLISRPNHLSLSHKDALQRCVRHAKLWLENADEAIEPESTVTYKELRERLNKIMASDYFTTTPEMKAPVEVAAAAASFQVPVQGSVTPVVELVQMDDSVAHYQQTQDDDAANHQGEEINDDKSSPAEQLHKDELEVRHPDEVVSVQREEIKPEVEVDINQREVESRELQNYPRRSYPRGGRSGNGRRGGYYPNGHGRGNGRGGGAYMNGRNQYQDQQGNYYQRNYHNNRGRGGRVSGGGGNFHSNNGSLAQASQNHAAADVRLAS
ncbi:hypothetical protein RJ641_012583 [Dillenia turbinata]|uniref:Uncharacterized protein n=1 Tax=Dillenia turbinata TaxID=194707 RepID=A0AAN8V2F0_9MAGN